MHSTVEILGVPMDLGTDRRGVDMGPSAIRYGGLATTLDGLDVVCRDGGDIAVPGPEQRDPDADQALGGSAKYLSDVRETVERLTERVREVRTADRLPLVLGGDHSIAIGTAKGVAQPASQSADDSTPPSTGIIWFDAHGDFNTPDTSPSGNVHGMPLAAILGKGTFGKENWGRAPGVDESNVAIVGLRSVDETEKPLLRESGVHTYTMSDVDARGVNAVVRDALSAATEGVDQLYVSLDLDVLDPDEAPGVGTPVRGGMTYREAHAAMELVYSEAASKLAALELVEVNPILDRHNRTAELACELTASALGDRIL